MSTELNKTSANSGSMRHRVREIAGAATGNMVEYFDFYIYATFAHYFQHAIIPPGYSETGGQLYVWGVFAASFLMRPIGSWLFGVIGDKYGRKKSMIASISVMAIGSLLFACLPTYAAVGAIAPYLLLFVRLLQGLSVGGEYGMVATYMSEMGLKGRRGLMTSLQYCMLVGGQLVASLLAAIAAFTVADETMRAWGWRVPFVIGGIAALISLWVRLHIEESLDESATRHKDSGSMMSLLTQHTRSFLLVLGMTAGGSMMYYIVTIYSRTYMDNLQVDNHNASLIMTIGLFVLMIAQPFFGMLADKISVRSNMLLFAGLSIVLIYPVYVWAFPAAKSHSTALVLLLIVMMLILTFYTSISALVKADLFPPQVRGLGVSFGYAVSNALFGGSAPTIALALKDWGHENWFYFYAIALLCVTLFCSWLLPKHSKYLDNEQQPTQLHHHSRTGVTER